MKYVTSELEGARLDAAVASALGHPFWLAMGYDSASQPSLACHILGANNVPVRFRPSTEWKDGGPVFEGEKMHINILRAPGEPAVMQAFHPRDGRRGIHREGPTMLVAAMRAFVASKFREEVELP